MADTTEKKLTHQEDYKLQSAFLKGKVAEDLADSSNDQVSDESYELLKFHGTYFGYNRDTATERKKQKLDKEYEFMVRTRIPAGRLTAQQYLAMEAVADKYANGTLRITTRQVFQFHVIVKHNLKQSIAEINHALLSTQSACGDVVRNITTSPAPINTPKYLRLRDDVEKVAAFVRPKTSSYNEIFLDEEADELRERSLAVEGAPHPSPLPEGEGTFYEPLYGATYLPRKFKIGLIVPEDNTIDVFTHDLGIVLIFEGETLKGYNLLLGGGMGMDHEGKLTWAEKKTYPRLATPIAFVEPDDLLRAVEAVVTLQRDHGDRTNRKHARLKYLVQEKGTEWTRRTLQEYFTKLGGGALQDPVPVARYDMPDLMGWHEQGDGKWFLGVPVPSGRIMDYDKPNPSGYTDQVNDKFRNAKYRTGLRAVIEEYGMNIVLTPREEIILADIAPEQKQEIEEKLRSYGLVLADEHTHLELDFMACVALPTCAKALAESERVQFPMMQDIQAVLNKHGLEDERISVRVTGCPNGCARPYVGDIGIVGRMPGHYLLFIGGDYEGTRLNTRVFDKVPQEEIGTALEPMLALYAKEKQDSEGFGDFCHRLGVQTVARETVKALGQTHKWAAEIVD